MRKIIVIVALLVVASVAGLIAGRANAETTPPPPAPGTSSIAVTVNSYHDDTRGTISCSRGDLVLVHGDGTVIMENVPAEKMICFVTIKRLATA